MPEFEATVHDSYAGLASLYEDNEVLSASDLLQVGLTLLPLGTMAGNTLKGGKLAKKAAGKIKGLSKAAKTTVGKTAAANTAAGSADKISKFNKLRKAADKSKDAYETVSEGGRKLRDKIEGALAYSMKKDSPKYLNSRKLSKAIMQTGGAAVASGLSEGIVEEGTQYIRGDEYQRGIYEDKPTWYKSMLRMVGSSANAAQAVFAPWDSRYSNDKEFVDNWKGGFLLGALMTGATSGVMQTIQGYGSSETYNHLYDLYLNHMDSRSEVEANKLAAQFAINGK